MLRHPDVGFINQRRFNRGMKILALPPIGSSRVPDLGVENHCFRILNHSAGVSGDALALAAVPVYPEPVKIKMFQTPRFQADFPDPFRIEAI